jgi:hypothetical protein
MPYPAGISLQVLQDTGGNYGGNWLTVAEADSPSYLITVPVVNQAVSLYGQSSNIPVDWWYDWTIGGPPPYPYYEVYLFLENAPDPFGDSTERRCTITVTGKGTVASQEIFLARFGRPGLDALNGSGFEGAVIEDSLGVWTTAGVERTGSARWDVAGLEAVNESGVLIVSSDPFEVSSISALFAEPNLGSTISGINQTFARNRSV